ncbi:hypothetical protein [Streptomyces sp. 7-21]|jgi:hypothetical protein|nr:hypothetical protein [Streptomyces sp. 7-21]MBL1068261.1 hypothetical protein [Streptomyces sp. 7-21]
MVVSAWGRWDHSQTLDKSDQRLTEQERQLLDESGIGESDDRRESAAR